MQRLDDLLDTADLAAAMTIDAFAGRLRRVRRGSARAAPASGPGADRRATCARLLDGSTLADIAYHLVPRFRQWLPGSWDSPTRRRWASTSAGTGCRFDQRHGREKFYQRFLPFRGGKKHQPQDSYSLRCIPQVHGAVRDALAQAKRVLDIELNSVTDNPLVFPDATGARTSRSR